MGTGGGPRLRVRGDGSLHDVEMAEHRGGENVHAGAVVEQELRDLATAGMGSRAERRLEVAAAPVPARVDQLRLLRQQFLDPIEIAVRLAHELVDQFGGDGGRSFHGGAPSIP